MECSVIILAAGRSGRMGKQKFALKFNKKKTFLEEIIDKYNSFGCNEIIVILNAEGKELFDKTNPKFPGNVKIAINKHPELERFYSLKTGLNYLKNKNKVFVHNVDNPLIEADVLKSLFSYSNEDDYYVPVYKGRGGHPVLLSKNVVEDILAENDITTNLRDFLNRYDSKRIEVESDKVLVNINTEEEYRIYFN